MVGALPACWPFEALQVGTVFLKLEAELVTALNILILSSKVLEYVNREVRRAGIFDMLKSCLCLQEPWDLPAWSNMVH